MDIFSNAFMWMIDSIHIMVPSYVAAVIILTIILKFALFPIDYKQRKGTAKMSAIQPKIQEIKKRYPDSQAQALKIQELYKKENISMAAGCLPAIVQMVILMAFFGALNSLANAQIISMVQWAEANPGQPIALPGFLWVKNIWAADSGGAAVMPDLAHWASIVKTASPAIAESIKNINYEAVIQPTLNAYAGVSNGWYLLPLIQSVTMYFSMGYSFSATPNMENAGGMNLTSPLMKLVMAGVTGYVCLTSNSLFTIYWIASNLLMFASTYFFKVLLDRKKQQEKNVPKA